MKLKNIIKIGDNVVEELNKTGVFKNLLQIEKKVV